LSVLLAVPLSLLGPAAALAGLGLANNRNCSRGVSPWCHGLLPIG
jgi:hypothetical protein